jgi:hypothetical protein
MKTKTLIPKDKQKLYYIQWQDAHANGAWFTVDQLVETINRQIWVCEEVGWIVYEDDSEVHIVARRGMWLATEDYNVVEYGMYQRIPKAWIMKKRLIK